MGKKTVKAMGGIILVLGMVIAIAAGTIYLSYLPPTMEQPRSLGEFMLGLSKDLEEKAVRAPKREKAVTWIIIGGVVIVSGGLIRKFPDGVSRFLGGGE